MEQIGPHQIRLEVLKLAYNMLRDNKRAEYAKKQIDSGTQFDGILDIAIDTISIEDILEKAEKFNTFISTKK